MTDLIDHPTAASLSSNVHSERRLTATAECVTRVSRTLTNAIGNRNELEIVDALQAARVISAEVPQSLASFAAASRAASQEEISLHLSHLVGVIKHTDKVDPKLFTPQLIKDVAADSPSIGALISGCRIVRTKVAVFLPSIKEVLEAIAEAHCTLDTGAKAASGLPDLIARAQAKLDDAAQRIARVRENEKSRIRGFLTEPVADDPLGAAPDLSAFDAVLVREVRAELGLAP